MTAEILPKKGHLPGLDGVRGLAIVLVLFSHSVIYGEPAPLRLVGLEAGKAGVTAFFVLSGFLITTLLIREEEKNGFVSLGLFYTRRALRLFPALWLYLAVLAAVKLTGVLPQDYWHSFAASLLYVRNIVGRGDHTNHLWSLSIEEQFYLLWPLVVIALPRKNGARLALALLGLSAITVWRVAATRLGLASEWALWSRSDFRFDAPLFGCALALWLKACPQLADLGNARGMRSSVAAVMGTLGVLLWLATGAWRLAYPGLDATVLSLLGVLLVVSQVGAIGGVARVFSFRPLVSLGRMSYGIYLWQQLFLGEKIRGFEHVRVFPVGLILTFAAAAVSYWFVELPLIRLKDRKFHNQAGVTGPVPSGFEAPTATAAQTA